MRRFLISSNIYSDKDSFLNVQSESVLFCSHFDFNLLKDVLDKNLENTPKKLVKHSDDKVLLETYF